ncbi:hypothetical protein AMTR_s00067p00026370 [Amborella trichopoda]|uniref:Uncharacterized protein n=1 Tax=Amborella trichopoda TaxID=13333 RepID=U5D945_AMBTC|nr:hypothetical protein AMTR_s00067p00026370 [Amborella trichopoda]
MSHVPLFGPPLHMRQQSQQLHRLEPAFVHNSTISSKTIAAITLAAAVQLVSGQCDYTGCSRIPSAVFSRYPDYFDAFVIFLVLTFASSETELGPYRREQRDPCMARKKSAVFP